MLHRVGNLAHPVSPAYGGGAALDPTIAATLTDALASDVDGDGNADPGDVIRYTATITPSAENATGVNFALTPDTNTALVGGSVVISPLALDDSYQSVGNMTLTTSSIGTGCTTPLRSVVCNDITNNGTISHFGPNAGVLTTVPNGSNTITTGANGTVRMNADGSFTYDPAAGFEGTDSFVYRLRRIAGTVTLDNNATVSIAVGGSNGMVWFATAAGGGSGRQANPISLEGLRAINNGVGTNPDDGDTIFLFEGFHSLPSAPFQLRTDQKLLGEDVNGVTLTALGAPAAQPGNSYPTLDPAGAVVSISGGATALSLGLNNEIAGFTVGPATTAISGGAVGALNVRDVIINNSSGVGLAITTSGTLTNAAPFTGFTSVTSNGGANGVTLTGLSGALALGAGSLNGGTAGTFTVSGGSVAITYSGNISQSNNAPAVAIGGGHTGATITLNGTVVATNGSGIQFDNADGTYNLSNSVTLLGGDAGIDVINGSSGTISLSSTNSHIASPTGTALTVSGGAATVTYAGRITQNSAARMITVSDTTGGSVSFTTAVANGITGGASSLGILIDGAAGSVTVNNAALSGLRGIEIAGDAANNATGTFTFNNVAITTAAGSANHGLIVNGDVSGVAGNDVSATIDLNNVDITNGGANLVDIRGMSGGSVDFDAASALTRSTLNGPGLVVTSNAGGTIAFNGTTKALKTGTSTAVDLTNNPGATIDFLNGNLDIETTSGIGFNASGGGTVTVQGSDNVITSTTGTALNVANTTIGAPGLIFRSISANGAASGIVLTNSGATAGLSVTGDGPDADTAPDSTTSGGTIQSATGHGVTLNNTQAVYLGGMTITGSANSGIGGGTIHGLLLDTVSITSNGDNAATDDSGINLTALTGTNAVGGRPTAIRNSTISNNFEFQVQITNSSGTLADLALTNNTISSSGASGAIGNLVNFLGGSTSAMKLTVSGGSFAGNAPSTATAIAAVNQGLSHTVNVSGATFTNNEVGVDCSSAPVAGLTFNCNVSSNDFQGSRAVAINSFHDPNSPYNRTFNATFSNNTIGTAGTNLSGSQLGNGISVSNEGAIQTATYTISGNHIHETAFPGISVNVGLGGAALTGGGQTNLTLQNNTFSNIDSRAVTIQDSEGDAPFPTICANISGNTFGANILGQAGDGTWMAIRELNGTVNVTQAAPTAATNAAELDDANGGNDASKFTISGAVAFGQGTCTSSTASLTNLNTEPTYVAGDGIQTPRLLPPTASGSVNRLLRQAFAWTAAATRFTRENADRWVEFATVATRSVGAAVSEVRNGLADATVVAGRVLDALSPALEARQAGLNESLGTIPAGESLTIVFDVTVNGPPVAQYSAQGTVSGNNFSSFLTDDPAVGGAADPTTTPGDRFDTTTTLVSSENPSFESTEVTFTATVMATEGALAPTGGVQFKDNGVDLGAPVVCSAATATTCTAQKSTTTLASGTRSITAEYAGGTNHDTSISNTVSQEVTACAMNPVVTTSADSGVGSLREAIANACPGTTITFDVSAPAPTVASPIALTGSALTLIRDVTISGPGASTLTVSRTSGTDRIFNVDAGVTATIGGLTISGGQATQGGGIANQGTLTLDAVAVSGNTATAEGGGIYSTTGTLMVTNSTVSGNTAVDGGGIYNNAALVMTNATVSGNTTTASGGGVLNNGASAQLTNVTVTANRADSDGNASGAGGGVANSAAADNLLLRNTIVSANFAGSSPGTAADDVSGGSSATSAHNFIGGDARLGVLANNGGPTATHALLLGSPALEAGDNAFATASDQRGAPRIRDSADVNATETVDIGAFEADPTIEDITDKTTIEDLPLLFAIDVGDGSTAFTSQTVTSSNTTLVPNLAANLDLSTATGSTRTVTITPAADQFGTSTITVTLSRTVGGTTVSVSDTFLFTVTQVNDPPTLDPIADPAAILEDAGQQTVNFSGATAGPADELSTQTIAFTATSSNPSVIPHPAVLYTAGSTTGSLTYTPVANVSGTATITVTVADNGIPPQSVSRTFNVVVTPAAETPSVTNSVTAYNTQTTSGLVLSRNAADGAEVTHFKITGISGGTLFLNDGGTPILDGTFITFEQGNAGLRFTPTPGSSATGHFTAQASTAASDAGLGGAAVTADIAVQLTGPALNSLTHGDGALTAAFTAPALNGGAAIANYEYSIDDGATWTPRAPASTSSPLVIAGLTNGTAYTVRVRAINSAGPSASSNALTETPRTVAGGPSFTSVTPGDTQLTLAFTAPGNGGAAITNYEYSLDNGTSWTPRAPASTASPLVITGLANGTLYTLRLRAINSEGPGAASTSLQATPRTIPGAPVLVSLEPGQGSLTVIFTAPVSDGGAAISNYEYTLDNGTNWLPRSPAGNASPFIIGSLAPETTFSVRIRAVNVAGPGPQSNALSQTSTAKEAQSINFPPIADQRFTSGSLTLGAAATSGLPIVYSAAGVCSVSGNVLTFEALGQCSVTAMQSGNATFAAAANVTRAFNILPTLTVTPTTIAGAQAGGHQDVNVSAQPADASWTASTATPWLTVSPAGGIGEAIVTVTWEANANAEPRTGSVTIGGETVTVTQAGCGPTTDVTNVVVPASGGIGSLTVVTGVTCAWTAASSQSWITIAPASGTGAATMTYQIAAWTGADERTATIDFGVHQVQVRQEGVTSGAGPGAGPAPAPGPPPELPGAPLSLSASFLDGILRLSWFMATTGAAVTGHVIEIGTSSGAANIGAFETDLRTTWTYGGVPDGVYYVRVRGRNAKGAGPASNEVELRVGGDAPATGIPAAPIQLTGIIADGVLTLVWNAGAGGGPISGHIVEAGTAPGLADIGSALLGVDRTFRYVGVPEGRYFFRVRAMNATGTSAPSNELELTYGVPGAPQNLATREAGGLLIISWDPPVGSTPTLYRLDVGTAPGATDVASLPLSGTEVSVPLSAIPPGVTFHVRVRGMAGAAAGPPSNEIVVRYQVPGVRDQ
jgi:hypothetical protein